MSTLFEPQHFGETKIPPGACTEPEVVGMTALISLSFCELNVEVLDSFGFELFNDRGRFVSLDLGYIVLIF